MWITNFIRDLIESKPRTRLYSIVAFWYVLLHADVLYVALFQNEELIFKQKHMLKGEYLLQDILHFGTSTFWIIEISKLVGAVLIGVLAVWVLPKYVTRYAYNRQVSDEYDLKLEKNKYDRLLQDKKVKTIDKQLEIVNKATEVRNKEEDLVKSETEEWNEEYETFKNSSFYIDFGDIIESYFEKYGIIVESDYNGNQLWRIDKDVLAYAVSNNLINFTDNRQRIELTDKGKYFVKKYQLGT